ncbi:MAG: hypothetical protein HYT80_01920 [Euryarchaeota archaeon]|nr:hypothetical protein [Euryarchaeota archaeon]
MAINTDLPVLGVLISLVLLATALSGCTSAPENGDVHIQDIHGLALDPSHPTRLYVATHHGLFVAENDTEWAAVTQEPFDMMGFTMHPRDGRIMYASGHPGRVGQGWAVGVVQSTDAGRTWTTLALKNEVDFHAMAMEAGEGSSNDTIYGFHGGKLHVSADSARTWHTRTPPGAVSALAVTSAGDVLAATSAGLYRTARGALGQWQTVDASRALAVASSGQKIVAYFTNGGLKASPDDGATWEDLNWTVPAGDYPWGIALGPSVVYVGTAQGSIHRSADQGASWTRIR